MPRLVVLVPFKHMCHGEAMNDTNFANRCIEKLSTVSNYQSLKPIATEIINWLGLISETAEDRISTRRYAQLKCKKRALSMLGRTHN